MVGWVTCAFAGFVLWDAVSRWVLWLIWFDLVVGCVGLLGVYLFWFLDWLVLHVCCVCV